MKTLLFTGGTGFLGKCVTPILRKHYEITTCGITATDNIKCDLATEIPELPKQYNVVLHACGKAHMVPRTEAEKQAFFDINYKGTVHLCKALEKYGIPDSLVFISTVAVYGLDCGKLITEEHPLNGVTPYAQSKIQAEEYLRTWCEKRKVVLGILRPSLLAGPEAPGNLGAMVQGIKKGYYFNINQGKARKSILMAEDIARIVPILTQVGGTYNVCDNTHPSFGELSVSIATQLGKTHPFSIPIWTARLFAKLGDLLGDKAPINTNKLNKIVQELTFSNTKAKTLLNWEPLNVLDNYKI